MRLIGHLPDEAQARRFADYMLVRELDVEVEPEGDGRWAVWIIDDEHVDDANGELATFLENPDQPKFHEAGRLAEAKRESNRKQQEAHSRRQFSRDIVWPKSIAARTGKCTLALVAISAVVFLLMQTNYSLVREWLSIVRLIPVDDEHVMITSLSSNLGKGQFWRLFTPMFIHFGFMHVFMNMMLLILLGGPIERRYGPWWMLLLVLVISGFSNVLEYVYSSAMYGGMSGVVFGLFGFVLAQSKYNPFWNFYIPPVLTAILLIWFVYCIVGLPGEIANFVHWGGLASGAVIGYLCAQYSIHRPNKP